MENLAVGNTWSALTGKVKKMNNIASGYLCSFCEDILHKPVQTCCGHRLCYSCATKRGSLITEKKEGRRQTTICPICEESTNFFADKCAETEIKDLKLKCVGYQNGCTFKGNLETLKAHCEKCSYVHKDVVLQCPFRAAGCPFEGKKAEVEKHIEHGYQSHLLCLMQHLMDVKEANRQLSSQYELVQKELEDTKTRLCNQEKQTKRLETQNESLSNEVQSMRGELSDLKGKVGSINNPRNGGKDPEDGRSSKPMEVQKHSVTDTHLNLAAAITNAPAIFKLREDIVRIDDRLSEIADSSWNGTFIWKIENYEEKYKLAVMGKQSSLFSTYFYTSKNGYKFRLRIYLNGDGMGKGSHVSVFVVIYRGKYDPLLEWPFNRKIKFTLLSQNGGPNHCDAFFPDPNSSSFQKPVRERNVASGVPLFISLQDFLCGGFIKDDCFFLQAEVL